MGLIWRSMTPTDLDAVAAIAVIGFPDHFEGRDCFENRLALNLAGCFVLVGGDGSPRGYLVAYPWTAGAARESEPEQMPSRRRRGSLCVA